MRTLDESRRAGFAPGSRLGRSFKLLLRLASMVWAYFTTGAAIRRAYRAKERRGEIYYVDD